MPDALHELSDERLIRVLGEYTGKAMARYRQYSVWLAVYVGLLSACMMASIGVRFVPEYGALNILFFAPASILVILVFFVHRRILVSALESTVWQLRRVYQLASSREDAGARLDAGTRMELELRLSEAQFVLATVKRFDHPEKFAAFRRVGPDSPFRDIELETASR